MMSLFRNTCVALLLLAAVTGVRGDAVIQLAVPSDTICLNLGTSTSIDFFVFNDAIDAVNIEAMLLSMEILQGGSVAPAATSPTLGVIQALDGPGQLFEGTTGGTNNVDVGIGQTQRLFDWDVDPPGAELLGTDPAKAFARVEFNTSAMTVPGNYTLRFQVAGFPTEFIDSAGNALSTDLMGNSVPPPINTGGLSYATELVIKVVPEPNAFVAMVSLSCLGILTRKRNQYFGLVC